MPPAVASLSLCENQPVSRVHGDLARRRRELLISTQVKKQGDLMSEIAAKLAERRGRIAAMQRHESDSDDDDDSGWDDSD